MGIRRVSVIAPMRNEAPRVAGFVQDLAAQDFDGDLEVVVADGQSDDGSPALLAAAAADAGLRLAILPNAARRVAPGLNACLAATTGDLIVRLDLKSRYPPEYLRLCARAAEDTGADNVGGIVLPQGRTAGERAAACAMDSAFGGIAWTRHARQDRRVDVDTVYCGAFRPAALQRVGGYDETQHLGSDDELNMRLRAAGGRVVLDPAIRAFYTPAGSLPEQFRKYYRYGLYKVPVMTRYRRAASVRSLVPMTFVLGVGILAVGGLRSRHARRLLGGCLGAYGAGALGFAGASVHRRRESWRLLPRVAVTFATFHVGYGLGMVRGWLCWGRLGSRP